MDVLIRVKGLLIEPNLLGKNFDINLGKFKGNLYLPRLNTNQRRPYRTSYRLSAPENVEFNADWGSSYHVVNTKIDEIEALRARVDYIFLVVEMRGISFEESQEKLQSLIPTWLNNFYELATLFSNQSFVSKSKPGDGCHLLFTQKGGCSYNVMDGSMSFNPILQLLSPDVFENVCFLCQENPLTAPEHRLLRSALDAFQCKEYRSSILDSCSALEVLLVKIIANIKNMNDNEQLKFVYEKTLGQLIDMAGHLKVIEDRDCFVSIILVPRNDIAHRGKFPDVQTTKLLILKVSELVMKLSPIRLINRAKTETT